MQAKWEQQYDLAIYSASNEGWSSSVCQNYGPGEYWHTKAVKLFEHPKRAFEIHTKPALVFVHLMPQFKQLKEVDAAVLGLWKAFKYSSIKASVFNNAQETEGLGKVKLLKASLTT